MKILRNKESINFPANNLSPFHTHLEQSFEKMNQNEEYCRQIAKYMHQQCGHDIYISHNSIAGYQIVCFDCCLFKSLNETLGTHIVGLNGLFSYIKKMKTDLEESIKKIERLKALPGGEDYIAAQNDFYNIASGSSK